MSARTVVITGANSGIGKETAVALASAGDRVLLACRNATKAADAVMEIARRSGSTAVEALPLDLASLASVRAAAEELRSRVERIDVLINNAGLIQSGREVTVDGFEMTFGVNHLGHFLFTNLLRDLLLAAPAARVINLASTAHWFTPGGLNFDDLQMVGFYNVWVAYGRSKLANIYFTQELARRWRDDGIVVSAVHPGVVATGFGGEGDTRGYVVRLIDFSHPYSVGPDRGADTPVWLATAATGGDLTATGGYWSNRRPGLMAPWAKRPTEAARLWAASERLVDF